MKFILKAVCLSLLLLQGKAFEEDEGLELPHRNIGREKINVFASEGEIGPKAERNLRRRLLGDWEFCSDSSECTNGCCSSRYSDDGRLKCTPLIGGYRPDTCVGSGSPDSLLGDWVFCSASSQCENGCCSSKYSDDGKLKCTPLNGGYDSRYCVGGEERRRCRQECGETEWDCRGACTLPGIDYWTCIEVCLDAGNRCRDDCPDD